MTLLWVRALVYLCLSQALDPQDVLVRATVAELATVAPPPALALPRHHLRLPVWPLPQTAELGDGAARLTPEGFTFVATGPNAKNSCCGRFLDAAFSRFRRYLFAGPRSQAPLFAREWLPPVRNQSSTLTAFFRGRPASALPLFTRLEIVVGQSCVCPGPVTAFDMPVPRLGADESYTLKLEATHGTLEAATHWGALWGLQTFVQMVRQPARPLPSHVLVGLPSTVMDSPRFPWRGLMVDTARHYYGVADLLRLIDGISALKLNTLHWHMVDAQSFAFKSLSEPSLWRGGAFASTAVYTHADVTHVVKYAAARGVRVVPEIDVPAHTASWGRGMPGLTVSCPAAMAGDTDSGGFAHAMDFVALNPLHPKTYAVVRAVLGELLPLFPDTHVHLGGDEVNTKCWAEDPEIAAFAAQHGPTWARQLQANFTARVLDIVHEIDPNRHVVLWDDAFGRSDWGENGDGDGNGNGNGNGNGGHLSLPKSVTLQYWRGWESSLPARMKTAGHSVLYSAPWYLDHTGDSWRKMYRAMLDEGTFSGGEACSWSEHADANNVDQRIFSRLPAVAERLWSPESIADTDAARPRLERFLCFLRRYGIRAGPVVPDFCGVQTMTPTSSSSAGTDAAVDAAVEEAWAKAQVVRDRNMLRLQGAGIAVATLAAGVALCAGAVLLHRSCLNGPHTVAPGRGGGGAGRYSRVPQQQMPPPPQQQQQSPKGGPRKMAAGAS